MICNSMKELDSGACRRNDRKRPFPSFHKAVKVDAFVKSPKSADLSLRAKRSNLITALILRRLPRRFAPRNDAGGLFTRPSTLMKFVKSPRNY